jgi:PPM family protein phosphatase
MMSLWKRLKKTAAKPSRTETANDASPGAKNGGAPKYEVVASLLSDVGCVRELNEDRGQYVRPADAETLENKGMLFVIADGMGGHSAGEVASQMAVDVISRAYYKDGRNSKASLEKAFVEANRQIHAASVAQQSLSGMGTTCTALVLQNGSALAAHVGDTRLYLVRGGAIYLMTEDHSEVMEMVKRGLLTLEEARHHSDKNVILRALGSHPEVQVTLWEEPFPVREGDYFLLCSDGLYDLVEDEEIKEAVTSAEPHTACEKLIALAKAGGGYDNITVSVISIRPPSGPETRARETRDVGILK